MTRRCLTFATDEEAQRLVADGEISMADLDELQKFRIFLHDMAGHCPECLEPVAEDGHRPGDHDAVMAGARSKWGLVLTDEAVKERTLLGWQAYCRGRVLLNDVRGLRR